MKTDKPHCFRCGVKLIPDEIKSHHCFACGASQGETLYYDDVPNPSLGSWSPAIQIED